MTQTLSTHLPRHIYYSTMADAQERDPIQGGANVNRSVVPMGRGFALWQRFNQGSQLVWVHDFEGRARALTPKQASVISLAVSMVDGRMLTMRAMAAEIGVNVSTVSRALAKAQAWGLLVYAVGRGRFAGLVIMKYVRDGGYFDAKRKAARARVQRWSEAARRRISRLEFNVASYILEGGRGYDSLTSYALSTNTYKDATLTAQRPWTAEDLADIR